jgi:4'-phosphopantetheinyl transferase
VISAQRVAGELTEDEVHVWKLDLRLPATGLVRMMSFLSRDELERAEKLSHQLHRRRSIAARGRLRELLASYTDRAPAEIEFEYGALGKPYLKSAGRSSGVLFNLSHSKDVVLFAITRRRKVGVDIEYIKPGGNYLAVAQFYFSERERSQLAALPERARQEAFFHGWARKEAFIKALGLGLAFPLDDFSVSVHPEAAGLLEVRGEQQDAARWQVIKIQIDRPFTAALAVEAGITNVRYFEGS